MKISVTILTRNSERYLQGVLEPLVSFDEVLIYDTGSHDNTLNIARKFPNTVIHQGSFIGFGPTHNVATNLAKNDWILSIDSDEIVTPELLQEISKLELSEGSVYGMPRHNEYKGRWIRGCGWHPDYQTRLYHRKNTAFTEVQVHEAVITTGLKQIQLKSPLRHYSYASASDFLDKMQSYSALFAKQNCGKKSSSVCKAALHGLFAFFKSYILKKGIFLGAEGFEISLYNANTAFYKYVKLAEANKKE